MCSKLLARVTYGFDKVIDFLAFVAGVFVIAIMLITCYEVVTRYLFHSPAPWGVEICEYMIFGITFLGAAWALKLGKHIIVDIVVGRLNPRAHTLVKTVTSAIGVILCFFLAWYAGEITWQYFKEGTPVIQVLRIPKYIFLAAISIGMLLLSIQFLRESHSNLMRWRTPVNKKEPQ